jgi:hypothetical protein
MLRGRLEVLTERKHGAADTAEIGEYFEEFIEGFAKSQHQATFGGDVRSLFANLLQKIQRSLVVSVAANAVIQSRDSFSVVIEDVRLGGDDTSNGVTIATKVRRKHFDLGAGTLADGKDCAVPVFSAAVGKIVTGDGGDDHVPQSQPRGCFGDAFGFVNFQSLCFAFGNSAKAAGASADVAADHESCGF